MVERRRQHRLGRDEVGERRAGRREPLGQAAESRRRRTVERQRCDRGLAVPRPREDVARDIEHVAPGDESRQRRRVGHQCRALRRAHERQRPSLVGLDLVVLHRRQPRLDLSVEVEPRAFDREDHVAGRHLLRVLVLRQPPDRHGERARVLQLLGEARPARLVEEIRQVVVAT